MRNSINRRGFLRRAAFGAAAMAVPFPVKAMAPEELVKLTILHTNDVHSRIDPFPDDHRRYPGMGGAAARASIIEHIRNKEDHLLLLDAGDIFQGTPYFNFFGGELEFNLMNEMGYDAATIGNHDFDGGADGLSKQIARAQFPMLNCNYDFRDTVLEGQTIPHRVFHKGKLKIGVTGVGVELDGLVPAKLFGKTKYEEPVNNVNEVASYLKNELKCDYVIVLSHLGYRYDEKKVSDIRMAEQSRDIDLIIGGHTHTFLSEPVSVPNMNGFPVVINQVGWAGVYLGKIDIFFHKKFKKKWTSGETVIVDKKSIEI